jgi:hypothetical protein
MSARGKPWVKGWTMIRKERWSYAYTYHDVTANPVVIPENFGVKAHNESVGLGFGA